MKPPVERHWPPCVEVIDDQTVAMLRAMTAQQKLQAMNIMSIQSRQLALHSIRTRHPEWSEESVLREYLRRTGLWDRSTSWK